MKLFQVTFEGTGYDIYAENGTKAGGFFVSVLVQASSVEEAFDMAYHKLVNSQQYQERFPPDEHPNGVLNIIEYAEILETDPSASDISGFVFYPEGDR